MSEPIPCSPYVLERFKKPCRPRKRHQCRMCGQNIPAQTPCCRWTGVTDGEGFWTCHMHPECLDATKDWDHGDWECLEPGDCERPQPQMYWPIT